MLSLPVQIVMIATGVVVRVKYLPRERYCENGTPATVWSLLEWSELKIVITRCGDVQLAVYCVVYKEVLAVWFLCSCLFRYHHCILNMLNSLPSQLTS